MNFCDIADIDAIRLDTPIRTEQQPRWQRKLAANSASSTTSTSSRLSTSVRSTPAKQTPKRGDRFIPHRGSMNVDMAHFNLMKENNGHNAGDSEQKKNDDDTEEYRAQLSSTLLGGSCESDKILAFKQKAPLPDEGHQNNLRVLYSQNRARGQSQSKRVARHIAQAPERILDAPDIVDDYYLNLLDWSKDNVLAIALDKTVYLWDASSGGITELTTLDSTEDDYVTSLSWVTVGSGRHLAVGTNSSTVQLWDADRQKQLREMSGHSGRVCSLSWNRHVLSSGSRDASIHNHDVRVAQHHVSSYNGHTQEVCGLSWSNDGNMLASGGNDNLLCLWDARRAGIATGNTFSTPAHRLTQHMAAVKALAWCPWQSNLLVSGAGTADRHLRFWNTSTGKCVNSIDTNSQVCAVQWSRHQRELISSHGFAQNQLTVWSYPTLTKVTELYGHSHRVLHMAQSPDGQTVCSVSPDETLRFWKVWAQDKSTKKKMPTASLAKNSRNLRNMNIR